jgi:hypothetical protein
MASPTQSPSDGKRPSEIAQANAPSLSIPERSVVPSPHPPASTRSGAPGAFLDPTAFNDASRQSSHPIAKVEPEAGANLPALIQLEAGTRMWIWLDSVDHKTRGRFTFRGTLGKRRVPGRVVPLEEGTQIYGSGTINQGQASLLVMGFVVPEAHYALQHPPTTIIAGKTGPGCVVPFHISHQPVIVRGELEVFFATTSVYEKSTVVTGPPQPQR